MKSANANASMMQLPSAMAASIKKEQSNSNTGNLGKISAVSSKSNACVKADVLLDAADLPRFKEAISGSNLSKIGLVEVLKKSFPGRRAAAIKNTLERVARREGLKATDKRWVLVEEGLSPP